MDKIEPLEWKWFNTTRGCIGVVFAHDKLTDLYHGYIGLGMGNSESADVISIINNGCRLTQEETAGMIGSKASKALIRAKPKEKWKS